MSWLFSMTVVGQSAGTIVDYLVVKSVEEMSVLFKEKPATTG